MTNREKTINTYQDYVLSYLPHDADRLLEYDDADPLLPGGEAYHPGDDGEPMLTLIEAAEPGGSTT